MKTYIKRHNNKILKRHDSQDNPPNTNSTHPCNCRNPMQCPVKGNCLQSSVLYEARVTTTDSKQTRTYIGVTGDNFKTRYQKPLQIPHATTESTKTRPNYLNTFGT